MAYYLYYANNSALWSDGGKRNILTKQKFHGI